MSDTASEDARPTDPVGSALYAVARMLAIAGGGLCFAMALLITVSVTGRYLIATPVPGDYDLVGIISGCAVFAFLPYCQMVHHNIVVDFFTVNVSPRTRTLLDACGDLLYLLIAILFTWRFVYGAMELRASGEVLANFNFYRWWTTLFDIVCMVILIAAIAYSLVGHGRNLAHGRSTAPAPPVGEV